MGGCASVLKKYPRDTEPELGNRVEEYYVGFCKTSGGFPVKNDKPLEGVVQWWAVDKVLAQPMLLELVVDYAMRENSFPCPKNIQSLRLVDKSFCDAVSKVLRKNKEPLYHVTLTEDNDELEKFVKFYPTSNGTGPAQPFNLCIEPEYFRLENYDSLHSFFGHCGKGLVSLWLDFPLNGGSLPGTFPELKLPILEKLHVAVSELDIDPGSSREELYCRPSNILMFLQSLLGNNRSLKNFIVPNMAEPYPMLMPVGFEFITLPSSVTSLELVLDGQVSLEFLQRAQLPNLTQLVLEIHDEHLTPEYFRMVLEKYQGTLQTLWVNWVEDNSELSGDLRFPMMPQLTELTLQGGKGFSFDVDGPSYSANFPKLTKFYQDNMSIDMYRQLTSGPSFPSVNHLAVGLLKKRTWTSWMPISSQIMQSLHQTFSNVNQLNIQIPAGKTSVLKYIFREMAHLTKLTIGVSKTEYVHSSTLWDSRLIGVSTKRLRTGRISWKRGLNPESETASIRMLTELQHLWIFSCGDIDEEPGQRMISDLTFTHAFLRMPKLRRLTLKGRFMASEEMEQKWKETGGFIENKEDI